MSSATWTWQFLVFVLLPFLAVGGGAITLLYRRDPDAFLSWFGADDDDPYCATCDGHHPTGAVLYTGQHLCHVVNGRPLPYVRRSA